MKPLSILYLEDSNLDVELVQSRLEAEGLEFRMTHARAAEAFRQALAAESHDLILLDYSVPGWDGLSALKEARAASPDTPVIITSGVIGEEIAIETLRQGAVDYVLKGRLSRLVPAIRRALQETEEHSRRREAEKALRESEERYRMLFETSPEAVWRIGPDGVLLECNPAAGRLAGRPAEDLVGRHFSEIGGFCGPDAALLAERFARQASGRDNGHIEMEVETAGGRKWVEVIPAPLPPSGLQVILRDVTERRRSEEHIRKSLKEKDVLLREIHHRVKNNLQIMGSLLNLQAGGVTDRGQRARCRECKNRIYTMSLVHEKLYLSQDFTSTNVRDSIESLARMLLKSTAPERGIDCDFDMVDLSLPLQVSIPLALIVNELITNAVKYAFPTGRGRIRIGLRCTSKESGELLVQDNGVGLPESMDVGTTESLGLNLVNILVQQMEGGLAVERKKGTAFRIQFPLKEA